MHFFPCVEIQEKKKIHKAVNELKGFVAKKQKAIPVTEVPSTAALSRRPTLQAVLDKKLKIKRRLVHFKGRHCVCCCKTGPSVCIIKGTLKISTNFLLTWQGNKSPPKTYLAAALHTNMTERRQEKKTAGLQVSGRLCAPSSTGDGNVNTVFFSKHTHCGLLLSLTGSVVSETN